MVWIHIAPELTRCQRRQLKTYHNKERIYKSLTLYLFWKSVVTLNINNNKNVLLMSKHKNIFIVFPKKQF